MTRIHQATLAAAISMACAAPSFAFAADTPYLLGDWNGARTRLADDGVTFNFGYASEIAHNTSGGLDNLTRYSDQWVLGTELNLQKLWGWHRCSGHGRCGR